MSNLCRASGESIQFVYNFHEGKGGKCGTESLRELTAGAEKMRTPKIGELVCQISELS